MRNQNTSLQSETGNLISKKPVWGPWSTAWFGLVVGIVFLVTQILVAIAYYAIKVTSDSTSNPLQFAQSLLTDGLLIALATFASTIICIGLIIIIVKVRKSSTVAEYLGFRRLNGKTILALLAITAGVIVVSGLLTLILGKPRPEFMVDIYNRGTGLIYFWIAVVIFAPAFEETFFRGFLFEGFKHSRIGISGTIAVTAFVWALLHIGQYGAYEIATIFVLGIVLGIVRYKTGSLWSPLIVHAFSNLIATLEVALYINGLVS